MERVEVGRVLLLVAVPASRRPFHLPGDGLHLDDLVRRMAVRADGNFWISGFQLLAMDACEIRPLGAVVARAASGRNIRVVSSALRIRVAQYFVCSMATRAGRSHEQPVLGQREAMNRIHVHGINVGKAKLLGHVRIAMT